MTLHKEAFMEMKERILIQFNLTLNRFSVIVTKISNILNIHHQIVMKNQFAIKVKQNWLIMI
jgi:hypothetical protein